MADVTAMFSGAQAALRSLHNQYERLDRVAENFANADTPGYRASHAGQRGGEFSAWMDRVDASVKPSDGPYDLALPANAYLEVQTAEGNAFTRRGDLRLDENSRLVTGGGDAVLDELHHEIRLPEGATLSNKGELYQGDRLLARLGRYQLNTPVPVPGERQDGGTLLQATNVTADRREITVGLLETSNVDPHKEQTEQLDMQTRARMLADAMQASDRATEMCLRDVARSK